MQATNLQPVHMAVELRDSTLNNPLYIVLNVLFLLISLE